MINPEADGISHINVYSKGRTELGRCLSNFAYSPFVCEDGSFNSIEGYWYWLIVPEDAPTRPCLRTAYGHIAKQLGREMLHNHEPNSMEDSFREKIKAAIYIKLNNDPELKEELVNTKLPLIHYYVYGNKVQEPKSHKWVIDYLNAFRQG